MYIETLLKKVKVFERRKMKKAEFVKGFGKLQRN